MAASPLEGWLPLTRDPARQRQPHLHVVGRRIAFVDDRHEVPAGLPTVIPCGPATSTRRAGLRPETASSVIERGVDIGGDAGRVARQCAVRQRAGVIARRDEPPSPPLAAAG